MRFPLGHNTWDNKEKKAAIKVLDSGFLTMGKKANEVYNSQLKYVMWCKCLIKELSLS